MRRYVGLAGYDPSLVARLAPRDQRFFVVSTIISVIAALGGGVGAAYGAQFPFGTVVGVLVGVGFTLLMQNLVRLLHAGSGYPVHLAIDDIDAWRPAGTAGAVLLVLGVLLAQPLVMLLMSLLHGAHGGLVEQAHTAWTRPLEAGALTTLLSLIISAPGWLRIIGAGSVRAYERERWIDDRMFVDDAFAEAQDAITALLDDVPGFSGALAVHTADPPYNTRPLVYGLDPALMVKGTVRFVKGKDAPAPEPVIEAPAVAPVSKAPAPTPPPPVVAPPQPPPKARADDAEEAPASWDDPAGDEATGPPAIAYFDVGRLQAKRAREHADVVVPFIMEFTGRPEAEVRGLLRAAPDDVRVHRLFSDWKTLKAILLKDAGFALDRGLAPILSIVVQRPVADVERRLRAAPRDKRLTGVFAPELARRLLKKNIAPAVG